jgi:phosphoribosylanthranilate isomerase
MTRVKICGIRSLDDAKAALDAGADMLGFIFYRPVRRYLEPARAAAIIEGARKHQASGWQAVGVFVDEPADSLKAIAAECRLDVVQLHGDETPEYVEAIGRPAVKVIRNLDHVPKYSVQRFMLDSQVEGYYGGSGVPREWRSLAGRMAEHILAGGLTPDNVREAIDLTQPWGVDVSSGVETDGVKDPTLIGAFLKAVRA